MHTLPKVIAVLAAGICLPLSSIANQHEKAMAQPPLATQVMLSSLDDAAGKIAQLAAAFSEEQYAWRPMEGVNSVKEAILHVAGAYYYLSGMLGHPTPAGINARELGKNASKDEVIAIFNTSVEHARAALKSVSEDALAEEITMFGRKAPRARLALVLSDHTHEHLGQLIAYARSNKVVPPWSN